MIRPARLPYLLAVLLTLTAAPLPCLALQQQDKPGIAEVLHESIQQDGVATAMQKYKALKANRAGDYDFSEPQLNRLGYRLMAEQNMAAALAVFRLNVEQFPESINVYDSLGECYLSMGKRDQAIASYENLLARLPSANMPDQRKNFFKQRAESMMKRAKHFEPPSADVLNYWTYYGGQPAGNWEMANLIRYQEERDLAVSYQPTNLYQRPVPANIPAPFEQHAHADVVSSFVAGVYRDYIASGRIADLSALWQEAGLDDVFPASFKRMVTSEGKQYFIPQAFQFNPIWYRKDIFAGHGWRPPETWDELLSLCDQIHAAGYVPFTVSAEVWPPPVARWFTILNLRLNGPEFHEQVMRGDVAFTDERIRNVFAHWRRLFEHNAFGDSTGWNNYTAGIRDIVTGRAVMYNLGEWIFESLPDSTAALLDFFTVPVLNPEVRSAEIVHTYGAFMLTDSRQPEAARQLLRYLASSASQQSNVEQLKRINANLTVDQKLYSEVQKRLLEHIRQTEVLVPLFEFNTRAELAQAGLQAFVDFWRQPQKADEILQELEAKRKELFSSN